jgi:hypothetical protein
MLDFINRAVELQSAVLALLQASDDFVGPPSMPGLAEIRGDLANLIEFAMNKEGICYVVETPDIAPAAGSMSSLQVDLTFKVRVYENPEINRNDPAKIQMHSTDASQHIIATLWNQQPDETWAPIQWVRTAGSVNAAGRIEYENEFKTSSIVELES